MSKVENIRGYSYSFDRLNRTRSLVFLLSTDLFMFNYRMLDLPKSFYLFQVLLIVAVVIYAVTLREWKKVSCCYTSEQNHKSLHSQRNTFEHRWDYFFLTYKTRSFTFTCFLLIFDTHKFKINLQTNLLPSAYVDLCWVDLSRRQKVTYVFPQDWNMR